MVKADVIQSREDLSDNDYDYSMIIYSMMMMMMMHKRLAVI
jgi:hypothetical protein